MTILLLLLLLLLLFDEGEADKKMLGGAAIQ